MLKNFEVFLRIYLILLFCSFLYKNKPLLYDKKVYDDDLSIVINMKNLTKEKHNFFKKVMKDLNSSRNYYFIKTIGKSLEHNFNKLVENSTVKIVLSNFPDSIFLPLVLSLFGNNIPSFIFFVEDEDLINISEEKMIKWYNFAYKKIVNKDYNYIFGNFQFINGKKIGCSLLLSKASLIQHLLYYTDSDTTHINPFIQLSLDKKKKFCFIPLIHYKTSNLENIKGKFSLNLDCPSKNDTYFPNICILLPAFKRNYFCDSFKAFNRQTYEPKFYAFIQNDSRKKFNLAYFESIVNKPIYHIWLQNWNSFFFLIHRFSSVFPCDFIIKYDDDQWPIDVKTHEKLINECKNKNVIIGGRGYFAKNSLDIYIPKYHKKNIIVDHCATPFITRTSFFKLDARNKIYSLYHAEDLALSINAWKLCNVISKYKEIKLIEKHDDGNEKYKDEKNKLIYEKEKNVFVNYYKFLIHSGYIPKKLKLKLNKNETINITIEHIGLNIFTLQNLHY